MGATFALAKFRPRDYSQGMNRCVACGDKYPDSSPWPACTQVCAARLAVLLVAALELKEIDYKELLPTQTPSWGPRPDLIPWSQWRDAHASAERLGQTRKPRWGG